MSAYEANSSKVLIPSSESLGLPVYKNDQIYLDIATAADLPGLYAIFEDILADGDSYPQETMTRKEFEAYFFSHYTFVVKHKQTADDNESSEQVLAGFYIKPNFPGRSSHLANYGLIVDKKARGKGLSLSGVGFYFVILNLCEGLGNFMVENCIRLAGLLGFKALYTNLVYANNTASIQACHRFGFIQVGRVPNAGLLKGHGMVDALQFYKEVGNEPTCGKNE